jgi:predicted AlkP superfamily pyrophosphatase or phosphodiesterase
VAALAGWIAGALACASGGPRAAVPAASLPALGTAPPERVVLVSVHALTPEQYLAGDGAPAMPTVAALGAAGIAAEAMQPVFPPATYPAHASLVTGLPPARHGVAADHRLGDAGVEDGRPDQASAIAGATLWKAVADAGGSVASLDWPATGGAAITDLLPDLDAMRRGASWPALMAKGTSPRIVELARRAGSERPASWLPGPARDAVLASVACDLLVADPPPRLLLLRLTQTEAALDRAPPGSPAVRQAFASADGEIARLLDCLRAKNRLATTAIAVVGDHGMLPVHTAIRPNRVLADIGLQIIDPSGPLLLRWDALARSNGGSAFVYAKSAELALLARRALEESARTTGAFRVMSADEMLRRGADPEAWFGLEAAPGYEFDDGFAGSVVAPAAALAVGGYAPEQPRMAAGFVAWGPGLRGPLRVPEMQQNDVAPTLARLLGVPLDGAEGRVLVGVLRGEITPAPPVVEPVQTPKRRPRGA